MRIHLSQSLKALIRRKVASGAYRDESEVVGSALQLLEQRDRERDHLVRSGRFHAAGQLRPRRAPKQEPATMQVLHKLMLERAERSAPPPIGPPPG